jgi:acyl dehydratase
MTTPAAADPLIDPDQLASLRARIGQRVTVSAEPYITEATYDAARHWAMATGDINPMWRDTEYARSWGHEDILAPPTILYAFDKLSIGYRGGLPGVHSFFAGTDWTWHEPIRRGTPITAEVVFKDLIERRSDFAEVSFQQISEVTFRDSAGVVIATSRPSGMRVSRRRARERERSRPVEVATYTPEEIEEIAAEYATETVQTQARDGAKVAVGDELPSIVRGPYTVTNAIAFEQAWGGLFVRAHGDWFDYIRRHPAAGLLNEQGIPEPPEAVHWDRDFARRAGVPQPYDYGPERIAWLAVLVTNWMGPTGFLSGLDVQIRKFNLVGDLTRLRGTVTAVEHRTDGSHLVNLDVVATNQREERTAWGTAAVLLGAGEGGDRARGQGADRA